MSNRLGDYIDILSGYAYKSKDFTTDGIPVIKIKNINPPIISLEDINYVPYKIAVQKPKYILQKGDVLIAMTGSHINQPASVVGRVARVCYEEMSVLNQRVGKIIAKEKVADIDYVYHYLSQYSIKVELAQQAGGAANQANISPSDICNLKVNFPDIEQQRHIGKILSRYDDLIANYRQQIKLLEEAAQRIYKEWFVDMRFPNHENAVFGEDGLPEGWDDVPVLNLFNYVRGRSYTSKEISGNSGVTMVNLKNIDSFGGFRYGNEKIYSGIYKQEQTIVEGDLVMGVTDMTQERRLVGHVALIPKMKDICTFSMDLIKVVPKEYPTLFLYAMFRFGGLSKKISPLANGVNVLHLKPEAMEGVTTLVPKIELAMQYANRISPIMQNINNYYEQIGELTEARDRLLPRLMSGEITV